MAIKIEGRPSLADLARNADVLSERCEQIRLAHDSLQFCLTVFVKYHAGIEKPNEHMNVDKARGQLVDAIQRMLRATE